MKYNLNDLAKEVCKLEGKKVQVNIAQVKEIIKCLRKIYIDKPITFLQAWLKGL